MSASSRSINFASSTAMASVLNCWVDADFGLISVSSERHVNKSTKSPVSILQGGRLREEHHFYKVNWTRSYPGVFEEMYVFLWSFGFIHITTSLKGEVWKVDVDSSLSVDSIWIPVDVDPPKYISSCSSMFNNFCFMFQTNFFSSRKCLW